MSVEEITTDLTPLKRPICTKKQFLAWAKQAEAEMLRPPWRVVVKFGSVAKGEFPHETDPLAYCCAVSQPQYHKVHIYTSLDHNGWRSERTVLECIRHEIAHSFWAAYDKIVAQHITDPVVLENLDDLEDTAVDRIATMPALAGKDI